MYWNNVPSDTKKDSSGLTLTWDVLKYKTLISKYIRMHRLTLTWDVLKF